MKHFSTTIRHILFFLTLSLPLQLFAVDFYATGEYQGKNIYIQNPLSDDQINFCTQFVYVNDVLAVSNPKTSAFEVGLDHLNIGDPVVIRLVHRDGCLPKIINPQVIRSKSKFQFLSVNANESEITWMTKGEYRGGIFRLEVFEHDAWHEEKTIYGKGDFETNQYSISPEYHAGDNRLRVKYTSETGNIFYSPVFEHFSNQEPVSFYPVRVSDKIVLSRKTEYEILDSGGTLIAKGNAETINCSHLKAGLYYLNIDNRTEKFFKK